MIILAIDPGYDRCGIAIIESDFESKGAPTLVFSDCFSSKRSDPFPKRLHTISVQLSRTITRYRPDHVALETLYVTRNQKTAMRVAEVRGVAMHLGAAAGASVHEYTPQQIKNAVTGNGRSDKRSMEKMLTLLLSLPEKKRLDDEYDAIGIGLTCAAALRGYPQG